MNNVIKQLGRLLRCSLDQGFIFDPLGQFVNADVDPAEASRRGLEGSDHVQSPACEGPRGWNRLDLMCWYMDSLGEELTTLTAAD